MSAVLAVEIVPAVAWKLPLVDPAGIVNDGGTGRSGLSLVNATVNPPLGAAAERETVQLVNCPELRPVAGASQFRLPRVTGATSGTSWMVHV